MNHRTAWTVYIVLRLLFFAVPFAVLYFIGWPWWLATLVAALIALSLSIIFLHRQRDVASESVYKWRHRDRTHDDIVEDAALDSGPARDGAGEVAPPVSGSVSADRGPVTRDPDSATSSSRSQHAPKDSH